MVLLSKSAFEQLEEVEIKNEMFSPNITSTCMPMSELALVDDLALANYTINLKPFINESVVSVRTDTPVAAVYRLFRSLSLRHLVVRSHENKVEGIITRKELMTDFRSDLS